MTAPSQPLPPCSEVLTSDPSGPRVCGRQVQWGSICPACYQFRRRHAKAAAEGRELATYRAGEPQTTITISLPESMAARLDEIAGKRGRSALLRTWIEPHLRG